MNIGALSASIAHHKRMKARARRLWSFKPKRDRKPPVKGLNSNNYNKIVDVYLSIEPKMRRILEFNRVPPWDRDDILQEIVTSALDKEYIRDCEAWMISALRFQIIMYFRMNKKFRTRFTHIEPVILDLVKEEQLKLAIESRIGWWHARLDIGKALRNLTPRMQYLIMMKANGYQDIEIGKATGYSEGSIRKLYSRGIQSLRYHMENSPVVYPTTPL